jgi:hypothetical protein
MGLLADMPDEYPLLDKWPIPPNLRIEGGALLCYDSLPKDRDKWQWTRRPNARLLYDFARLAEDVDRQTILGLAQMAKRDVEKTPEFLRLPAVSDGKAILDFARQWGVLRSDSPRHPTAAQKRWGRRRSIELYCLPRGAESFDLWHLYALILQKEINEIQAARGDPAENSRVAQSVTGIANMFGLRPALVPTDTGKLTLRLASSSIGKELLAALSYQLMVLAMGGQGMYACTECGKWFSLKRGEKPRNANQATYCQSCGKAAAMRAASRRYYQSRKLKERAHNGTQTA